MLKPMITERTLKNWRGQALGMRILTSGIDRSNQTEETRIQYKERDTTITMLCERILRMTQELLDQHLLRKEKKE